MRARSSNGYIHAESMQVEFAVTSQQGLDSFESGNGLFTVCISGQHTPEDFGPYKDYRSLKRGTISATFFERKLGCSVTSCLKSQPV